MKKILLGKAVFAGCVRNCEYWLPKVLTNIKKYSSYFSKSHFIFIENDSTDKTKEILKKWYKNKNYSSINMDGLKNIPRRGLRLEAARNTYLKIIKDSNNLKKYDFIFAAGGHPHVVFSITYKNLIKYSNAIEQSIVD